MRARIAGTLLLAFLAPSAAFAMSWCSERELIFESADMCATVCPSACTVANQRTQGSSGPCGSGYRGFVFSPSLNRTYALTAGSFGVDGLVTLPDYTAKGAVLKSAAENGTAATLTRYFGTGAWIAAQAITSSYCGKTGKYHFDAATCEAACSGAGCVAAVDQAGYNSVQPGRFFWRNGDPLNYSNFAAGQPDNTAGVDDLQAGFTPKGEHWVETGSDGTWSDSGKHLADQVHARPLIVEFAGALECVNGETGSGGSGDGRVCGKDFNGDGELSPDEFRQCLSTSGGYLCPIDVAPCSSASNSNLCPLGNFPCLDAGQGPMCSRYSCSGTEDQEGDDGSYQDDGGRDENGRCLGQIFIFNGHPSECKEPGVSTTWFQCCSTDESSFLFIEKVCGTGDKLTASAMKARRTHFIGTYCKKRFPLIGCVQSAQVHCIFESKLGRIVQEQGRMQLKNFQGPFGPDWGTPETPNCRGFTPEEFQFLDFSKMDLSEFFADIQAKAASAIKGELKEKIDDFYDNITH